MATGEIPRLSQRHFRPLVGERGRIDFARLDVDGNAVQNRPVDVAAQNGVQLADARLGQVNLLRMPMERFCGAIFITASMGGKGL